MRKVLYRKTFTYLAIALVISSLLNQLFLKNPLYFCFLLAFFSVFYILIGWFIYLRLDGVSFFSWVKFFSRNDNSHQKYWFKGRTIDAMEDEHVHLDLSLEQYEKLTMYSYLVSGALLMVFSFYLR